MSSAHRTVALSMIELRERAATFFADSGSYLFAFADNTKQFNTIQYNTAQYSTTQ